MALGLRAAALVSSRSLSSRAAEGEKPILHRAQGVGHIIELNRPRALNALNWQMVKLLHPLYAKLEHDATTRVVVLRGNGEKAFCAGGDVVDITKGGEDRVHFFRDEYKLIYGIAKMTKPHVAIIDGITMGGGAGISINGRFRVCTEKTLLAMPEATIGFFCDVGGSHFLPRLNPDYTGLAEYMGLAAGRLAGADVYHAGFATHFVHSSMLGQLVDSLCDPANYDQNSSSRTVADILDHYTGLSSKDLPAFSQADMLKQYREVFTLPSVTAIVQQLAKVADPNNYHPQKPWAANTLKKIASHSPTSLHVILEQIRVGVSWDLRTALRAEYNIGQAFMSKTLTTDFHEGVRAVLIDKDNAPKWNPAVLKPEEADAYVRNFFNYDEERLELEPFSAPARL